MGRKRTDRPRGFTLAELMVVLAIIGLLIVVGLPSFQNLSLSSQFSQVNATMSSLMTTAMIPSYEQRSGLFVSRAQTHPTFQPGRSLGQSPENPALDFQEVRVISRAPFEDNPLNDFDLTALDSTENPYYRMGEKTKPGKLSPLTWLAPDYAIDLNPNTLTPDVKDQHFKDSKLTSALNEFPAKDGDKYESLVNAFFIVLDQGECVQAPPSELFYGMINSKDSAFNYHVFSKRTLQVDHTSARGMLVYGRDRMLQALGGSVAEVAEARRAVLREQSTPLYCTRFGGKLIRGPEREP